MLALVSLAQAQQVKHIDSLINAADYPAAITAIQRASGSAQPLLSARLSNKLAEVFTMQGRLNEAEQILITLLNGPAREDPFLLAETKTNLGFLYLNKARNDMAVTSLQEALDLYQKAGKGSTIEAARCLAHLSLAYTTSGKFSQAEENGRIALQLRQKLLGDESEEVAASYNDLGLIYSQTDTDKALEYYEMALNIYEKLHGQEHRKIAIANNNIGSAYRSLKLYGDAITSFENAETIWKRIYPDGHPNQALALVNLGLTYGAMGNTTAAMGYYERALAMYRKAYGDKHSDIAAVLNQMGILAQSGEYDQSLNYFQQALVANAPAFSSANVNHNPKTSDYYNAKVMLFSLRLKAETLESRYLGKTLKLSDMKLALATLQTCDTLIDNIRFNSTNESDKLEIGASANDVYESGVRIAQAISEVTMQRAQYERHAFYFAEKSKSAVLQESIADAEAKSFAGIPQTMLEMENTLKSTLAWLGQKLSEKPAADEEAALRESIFQTNREYQAFVRKLETDYPAYFNLKFNRAAPSIADIQKLLGSDKTVVSYFVAEKSARLYAFIITQKSFRVYASTLPPDFDRLIRGFTNSIFYMAPDAYEEYAVRLSKLLLRGVPATKEVIIIPAGRLGTIPFEALVTGSIPKQPNFSNYPYLLHRSAISYEFSAGLLLQKSAHVPIDSKSSILLCAPISFPEKDNLEPLPATQQEVTTIASLFGGGARVALGSAANETLVKSGDLAGYQYLHFATHGIVDETSPELSRIFLQNSDTEDGNVFSGEIFNLKLNAELCVLSACQTGLGKYSKGEGVIGLSRALVYAGARTIMVSYWSVADESTAELMSEFYRILLTQPGMNQRTALQLAKQNMVRKGKFSSPFFWAPFVLIGS